jgi:putative flippase GtrA
VVSSCVNTACANEGVFRRIASRNAASMFVRNTVVGTAVFAIDLLLLWALVRFFEVPKLVAATVGFVIASSLHYAAGRSWIFRGSSRRFVVGYVYFLINAGVGLVMTLLLYAAFIRWTSIDYLASRVIISLFAGFTTFLLNAIFNFRRL